jgi:hypothetical protein
MHFSGNGPIGLAAVGFALRDLRSGGERSIACWPLRQRLRGGGLQP